MATTSTTLAVLIDADNAQPAVIDGLLAEIAKYGTATVKRRSITSPGSRSSVSAG